MAELPCQSHRLQGLEPITEVQPPLKWCDIHDKEFEGSYFCFEKAMAWLR
jgi:hypothetical protein